MSITEADRFQMHAKFIEVFGEDVANTAMEQIKPIDWDDFARKSDIERIERRLDRLDRLDSHVKWLAGIGVTLGLSMIALLTQVELTLVHLTR